MKKLLSLILALALFCAALPLAVFADGVPPISISPAEGGNPVCEIVAESDSEITIRLTFNPDDGFEVDEAAAVGSLGAFGEPFYYDVFSGAPDYVEFTASKEYREITVTVTYKQSGGGAMKGDLDGDKEITVSDALIALRIAAKLVQATEEDIAIGDVDGDGDITVSDALMILRVAAKLASQESLENAR